jgi:hypothetical protein
MTYLLGAAQQRRHLRHPLGAPDSRRGHPLPQARSAAGVGRALPQRGNGRTLGDVRAGRILELRGQAESTLPGGDEAHHRRAYLEVARQRGRRGPGGAGGVEHAPSSLVTKEVSYPPILGVWGESNVP